MGSLRPLRILIVEDEALLAMDMEMTFAECGHVVVGEAECLHSAEALADDLDPELAFVDFQLARGTNGLQVLAMIKRRWQNAAVVFVTANVKQLPVDFAGALGVIAKPYSRDGLVTALTYVGESLFAPPPRTLLPSSFTPSPALKKRLLQ